MRPFISDTPSIVLTSDGGQLFAIVAFSMRFMQSLNEFLLHKTGRVEMYVLRAHPFQETESANLFIVERCLSLSELSTHVLQILIG